MVAQILKGAGGFASEPRVVVGQRRPERRGSGAQLDARQRSRNCTEIGQLKIVVRIDLALLIEAEHDHCSAFRRMKPDCSLSRRDLRPAIRD